MRIVAASVAVLGLASAAMASVFSMAPGATTMNPGETLEIDLYVSDVYAGVRAYSAHMGIVGGNAGSVACVHTSSYVDETRDDWIFAGLPGFSSGNWAGDDCLCFGISDDGAFVDGPRYMGTMVIEASPDAEGVFDAQFIDINSDWTTVIGAASVAYPITDVYETQITVAASADNCVDAVEAFVGPNYGSNRLAGLDEEEAGCQGNSNHDIWFYYTATCSGQVQVRTNGSQLQPWDDSVLSVYDACGGMEIACDDDSGTGLHSALTFSASGGSTYWIRAAGFDQCTGSIVVDILPVSDCQIAGACYAEGDRNPLNECEACLPDLTATAWSLAPQGTPCGSANTNECDSPDACSASGVCEPNHKPDGTACPDDGNECSDDFCVSGTCSHPLVPVGSACGDPNESECDLADTCDASGICQPNHAAASAPCGLPDDTDCDNPDTCDGSGTCLDNHEIDGMSCPNDGNECTDDVCASGVCAHPSLEAGSPCGDQATETQCDHQDTCDGSGSCLDNLEPDDTPCDDGDACTTGDESCQSGVCTGTMILEAPSVVSVGCRRLEVTPLPAADAASVALIVTSPAWPCLYKYVGSDGRLTDTAFEQPIADWGTVYVTGQDIVPNTAYEVHATCDAYSTPPGTATTMVWGDTNGNHVANTTDIICVVHSFEHNPPPDCTIEAADIAPCTPDGVVNLLDILDVLDAFQPTPYPCPDPCEPIVTEP